MSNSIISDSNESSGHVSLKKQDHTVKQDIINSDNSISEELSVKIKETKLGQVHASNFVEDDNGSILVIILQCETKSCDKNISNLKWVFSDPYFTVQVCAVDPPADYSANKTLTQDQYLENYYMRKALNYASEGPYLPNTQGVLEPQYWWNKIPVIIVKDSSISNIPLTGRTNKNHIDNLDSNMIGGMKKRIKIALDKANQADLFFLCKWNDQCDKHKDVEGAENINFGSSLKWSRAPTSTQCVMYKPGSRDYIQNSLMDTKVTLSELLNSNISKERLLATVFSPNIIDYDIDMATSSSDYAKLNECSVALTSNTSSTSSSQIAWLIVMIIIIIIVAWIVIQFGSRYMQMGS